MAVSKKPEGKYHRLDGILDDLWRMLAGAVKHHRSPLRTPVFITSALDGAANGRVVVLRGVERDTRTLQFHSDYRAAKIAELRRDPRAQAVFYLPSRKIQIRAAGHTTVHYDDALAAQSWQRTGLNARRSYLVDPAPASPVEAPSSGLPDTLRPDSPLTPDAGETGWLNFAAISFIVQRIDWLYLAGNGHRRALFEWQEGSDTPYYASWLIP